MTRKERNFRTHNANTRNTRNRKSKVSSKGGSRLSSLQAEIKEWEPSKHFKDGEELFIFEKSDKNRKRLIISNLFKSNIYKNEKSSAKNVRTSLDLNNSVSYLSYLFDGTPAEDYTGANPSTLSNKFFHGSYNPLTKESPKKNLIFDTFRNSYIIKPPADNLVESNPWKLSSRATKELCNEIYNSIETNNLDRAYKILDKSSNGTRSLLFSVLGLIHFQYFKMQLFSVENEFLSNIFLEKKFGQNTIVDSGGELSNWVPFIIHFQKYLEDVWNRNSLGFNPPGVKAKMTTGMTSCNHMVENTGEYSSFIGGNKNEMKGGSLEWGNFIGIARNAAMVVEKRMQEPISNITNNSINSYSFNDPYSLSPFMMMLLHKSYLCLRLSRKYLLTSMYLGEIRSLITINEDLSLSRMTDRNNKNNNNKKLEDKKYINAENFIRRGDINEIAKNSVLNNYSKIIDRCVRHLSESPLSINDPNFKNYLLYGDKKKDKLTNESILRQIRLRSAVRPLTYKTPLISSSTPQIRTSFSDLAPEMSSNNQIQLPYNFGNNMGWASNILGGKRKNKKDKKSRKSRKN